VNIGVTRSVTIGDLAVEDRPDDFDGTPWSSGALQRTLEVGATEMFTAFFKGKTSDGIYDFSLHFTDETLLDIHIQDE
jgi:hypothetical protein